MQGLSFAELCDAIKALKSKKVVLLFHTIGDRDAVGSATALSEYFDDASIVTPDFITNNARRMLQYIQYEKKIASQFPQDAEAALVFDANNLYALGKLGERINAFGKRTVFIDHHAPHGELTIEARMFNDESYNSTASIVYEVLKKLGGAVTKGQAFLLLNGISADSADLQNSSPQTFMQISELLAIAKLDFSFFSEYFKKDIPVNLNSDDRLAIMRR